MRGLPSILSLFRNEFNKFNITRTRMLASIYHMTNTLNSDFYKPLVVYRFYCMALFHSQTRRHMIIRIISSSSNREVDIKYIYPQNKVLRGLSQKVVDFLCYKKTIQCIAIKFYL